jgi:outer membrane protein TolC
MRLTTKICAIVSCLALALHAQVGTQTPAPAAPAQSDEQLRDALRRALDADTPPAVRPSTPELPTAPTVVTPTLPPTTRPLSSPMTLPPAAPAPMASYPTSTNIETISLSLAEAIQLALEHNLDLQVARYNPVIAEYDRRSLYGDYDPTFSASASRQSNARERGGINLNTGNQTPGTRSKSQLYDAGLAGLLPSGATYGLTGTASKNSVTTPIEIGTNSFGQPVFVKATDQTWNAGAEATISQPLLRDLWIDGTRLSLKLARRDLTISELTLEQEVMRIVNETEQNYYALIAARELVRVNEADVAVKKQFFEEQRRRVEVGTLAPLQEKFAQSELARSEIALIEVSNDALTAEAILKGLIRDNFLSQLNVRLALTDRLLAVPATFELQNAVAESLQMRPDLQARRVDLEKLQIQLKFDNNQLYPRLDLQGTLGYNGLDRNLGGALNDIADRRFEQSRFGVALTFPLTMQAERNNRKSTKAALAQQVTEVKQLENEIIRLVEEQIRLLQTYWKMIPLTREQTAYAQAALEAEQKMLAAGKSTSYNVLNIATDLTRAQNTEIETLRDYNRALSELAFRKGTTLERWRIDRPKRQYR